MIKYKVNIIDELKNNGYSLQRIRTEKIFSQSMLTYIRRNKYIDLKSINKLCELLQCQPGDLLEWVPDDV